MYGTNYLYQQTNLVKDKSDFIRSGVPGAATVGKLLNLVSRLLVVPDKQVNLYILGEHAEGYLIEAFGGRTGKTLLGKFYWLPKDKIFDIYDEEGTYSMTPLIGWRNKTLKYENYSSLLKHTKQVEKSFSSLLSVL